MGRIFLTNEGSCGQGMQHRAETLSLALPYPDADISSYEEAKKYLRVRGMRRALELYEAGELRWER